MPAKPAKRAKGSVGEGEAGKKANATQHAGGKSVSEKSQARRTWEASKNLFEKCTHQVYFVDAVKDRQMSKNVNCYFIQDARQVNCNDKQTPKTLSAKYAGWSCSEHNRRDTRNSRCVLGFTSIEKKTQDHRPLARVGLVCRIRSQSFLVQAEGNPNRGCFFLSKKKKITISI